MIAGRSPFTAVVLAFATLLAGAARADMIGPDPALSPAEVIEIQLNALKDNDDPVPDAGIAQTFALAHPLNKAVTGPLPHFAAMIRSPAYRPLIGHVGHQVIPISVSDAVAAFCVVVEPAEGTTLEYYWEVARVTDGPDAGAWLTTRVSVPAGSGRFCPSVA